MRVFTTVILLFAAPIFLSAQDVPTRSCQDDPPFRFFDRPIDFWRIGKTYESERKKANSEPQNPSALQIRESIWAEPVKLPDGRYSLYVPPKPVLDFLENPTKESARAYVAWQEERANKLKAAMRLLQEVKAEIARERREARKTIAAKKPTKDLRSRTFSLVYFHSDS